MSKQSTGRLGRNPFGKAPLILNPEPVDRSPRLRKHRDTKPLSGAQLRLISLPWALIKLALAARFA